MAGLNPKYLSKDEIPEGSEEDPKTVALLEQPYMRDDSKTIGELVKETIAKTGENIKDAFLRAADAIRRRGI